MVTTPTKALQKSFPFEASAIDESLGTFSGYASTFTVDDKGDRVAPGAFKRTLAKAKAKRDAEGREFLFSLTWGHDPNEPIGAIYEAFEDSRGLFVRGLIDMTTRQGKRAYSGIKKKYCDGLSIFVVVKKSSYEGAIRRLDELDLVAVGVGVFPINREARVTDVKSAREAWMESMISDMATVASRYGAQKRRDGMGHVVYIDNADDDKRDFERRYRESYGEAPVAPYRIVPGESESESREAFEAQLRKQLREESDIYMLHGKAYDREVELRRKQREQKQAEQKAALDAERRERAEKQAAMSAETFSPESFSAATGLDVAFVRRWFTHIADSGVTCVDADGLVLRAQDVRNAAKRDYELIETQALRARNKRLERAA